MSTLKKLVIWLFVIMIISFSTSAYFFNKYGVISTNPDFSTFVDTLEESNSNYLVTKEIDYTNIDHISLSTISEHVIIEQSSETSVGTISLSGYSSDNAVEFDIETNNNKIDIGLDYKNSVNHNLTLKLVLPNKFFESMELNTTSGDSNITIVNCNIFEYNTVSGDINSSILYAKEIELNSTSGDFKLSSVSGDLSINTSSGNVVSYYELLENNLDIITASGNVRLSFGTPVNFELDFKSVSGDYDIAFPIKIKKNSSEHNLNATSGNAKNKIDVTTISGDLRIH